MAVARILEDKCLDKPTERSPRSVAVARNAWVGAPGDVAVLCAATLIPIALNIRHLGFYADDLGNIGRFESSGDSTIADYFRTLYALPGTRGRPAMDLYLAALFRFFGDHPLGYHAANVVVIFVSVLLFYMSLRLILKRRLIALTIPLIFVLLPNYSSARFVPCTFMIGLSLMFSFLNLYALIKASTKATLAIGWAFISVVSILISGLLYEVLLPLFILHLLVVWYLERRKSEGARLTLRVLALLLTTNAMALLAVVVFKLLTATRPHRLASIEYVVTQAVLVHFYKLGLRLPVVAAKVILFYGDPVLDLLALVFAAFVFWYFLRLQGSEGNSKPSPKSTRNLVGFGLLIFAFALTIFVAAGGATGFTATGFENRTAIAVSLGVAFVFSGGLIWFGDLFKIQRAFMVPLLITLMCAGELLALTTVGGFWAAAAERRELVLNSIHRDVPTLLPHSVLLVDGVCPYIGPGIVFEGHQDTGGALQMLYRDPSLRGDVVTPSLRVHQDGIETSIYGRTRYYPYGNLKIYDFRRKKAWDLQDVNAAIEYFGELGPAHTFCPEGNEGDGVSIF